MEITLAYDQNLAMHRYKYLALYHAIRTAIVEGTLPGGTKLPSTRRLAVLYDLSRGSASQVYDMLLADGYVQAKTGRGTFVAEGVTGETGIGRESVEGEEEGRASASGGTDSGAAAADSADPAAQAVSGIVLSAWGQRVLKRPFSADAPAGGDHISFCSSGLRMEHFPYAEWRSALAYAGGQGGGLLEDNGPPAGDEGLRQAIAAHLRITRGIRAHAEQIVLFSGSMQGIVLLTQLLLSPGSPAVVEDPGYHGIHRSVEVAGGRLLPGEVDDRGLVPEDWDARLLFVTSSRQFPTGAVLPLERRRTLLEWAQRHNAVIVEDDYDSEFRWAGRPIEPLKALDRGERVVYIGSFSGSMFATLRLGYAVLPPALVQPVIAAKALYEPLPAGLLEQRALARFMNTGGYHRHLRRMTRIYGERGRLLRSLLGERLGSCFEARPGDAGLQVYARWLGRPEAFAAFRAAALAHGTDFRDVRLYRTGPGEPAACFSFAHLSAAQLVEGVQRLVLAADDVQNEA
ncbi:GntR family transcriptional regulator [Paenibacillus albidus]|uniref:GntR family transcriptional regulator n=1 Tax=Paenibacillus albidus TaxID=2041023 RepID=A0A917FAB7_9BACL|nr:PLP-dependent aminotransferase family protein [Paenibacillus albidus]GGF60095.1 GntR family transcriptional regulator [Paenibacillus albidus]